LANGDPLEPAQINEPVWQEHDVMRGEAKTCQGLGNRACRLAMHAGSRTGDVRLKPVTIIRPARETRLQGGYRQDRR
jgi:hypothetical protein